MSNCCNINHVWGDHLCLVCDYCQIEQDHFRGPDSKERYEAWLLQHQHIDEPCPTKGKK